MKLWTPTFSHRWSQKSFQDFHLTAWLDFYIHCILPELKAKAVLVNFCCACILGTLTDFPSKEEWNNMFDSPCLQEKTEYNKLIGFGGLKKHLFVLLFFEKIEWFQQKALLRIKELTNLHKF